MKKYLPENFMITDSTQVEPLTAAKMLPPNSAVILRDYDLSYEQRLQIGRELKIICAKKNMPLLIAKDIRLAVALNADGMHFPELMLADARRMKAKKPEWIITIAAHTKRKVIAAYNNKLDGVLISPVNKTTSHPDKKPLGIQRASLSIYRGQAVYALGGIGIDDKNLLVNKGFRGIAGISWPKACVKITTVDL